MCLFLNGKALAIGLDDEYHIKKMAYIEPGLATKSYVPLYRN